jgi:signal transduction histidine kinase
MPIDDDARSVREQTDESLRAERDKVDHALQHTLAAVDETADAVIVRARERADELLARARAKTDRAVTPDGGAPEVPEAVGRERAREDLILRRERATADESLREERAAKAALLSTERDETDKDLLTERTRSDAALATRDEFLAIVSHDLRNMLGVMVSSASLMVRTGAQEEQRLLQAQRIQRAAGRMNRLIGDLVDVASIEAGRLAVAREPGDPAQVVAEAVEAFQAQATSLGLSVAAELVPPPPPAAFDPARILQVLTNLIGNAIKFTPAGGKIVARVGRDGDDVRFTITDTGVGIPPDKLEAVFERFIQVSHDRRGVGLGLYISRCIVQGHGGRIWAESQLGEGSAFHFTIPVNAPPA